MKKLVAVTFFAVPAFVVALAALSALAQEPAGKVKVRPKPTQQPTQQGVVSRVVERVVPGGSQNYQRAAQEPDLRPDYSREPTYQNPIVRRIEFGDMSTLREAQQWLSNPRTMPDRSASQSPDTSVPLGRSTPFFSGRVVQATPADAREIVSTYGSTPTGMVLEGAAAGLGTINDLQYDAVLNAFVLDERAVYFSPIAPRSLAALCRAIARDDRVGVALGQVQIIYGKLPHESQVAIDMKLADNFLGNITFAQSDWLPAGYPLAKGYTPRAEPQEVEAAVTFKFSGFQFGVSEEIVRATGGRFEVRVVPISKDKAPDGGALPDYDKIAQGETFRQFDANAQHVANEIGYYRREGFVDRAFRYGEVAAFIRALKAQGVELDELAALIERSTGVGPVVVGPSVAQMQEPVDRLFEAWRTLNLELYLAQWSRNAVQKGEKRTSGFAEIRESREELFARLTGVGAVNVPIYLGFQNGQGLFYNAYILTYRDHDGQIYGGRGLCERYKVGNEGGRWVIVENLEDASC